MSQGSRRPVLQALMRWGQASFLVAAAAVWGVSARAVAAPYCVPQALERAGRGLFCAGVVGTEAPPSCSTIRAGEERRDLRERGGADAIPRARRWQRRGSRALVLSWQVVNDATAGDRVYVGFFDAAGGQGNMFEMTRLQNAANADGGTGEGGATFNATTISTNGWYWTGTQWSAVSGLPKFPVWLGDDGRLDVSCESSGCDVWTIRLRVPLVSSGGNWASPSQASGLQLPGTTFKFFYEIKSVENQLVPTYSALEWDNRGVDLTDPSNFSDENALGSPRFPDVAGWPVLGFDTSDPTCVKGMSFDASTVKVVNGPSGVAGGTRIDLAGANTFHLAPVNHTGSTWAQASLLASLRISDWGPARYAAPTWRALPGCGATVAGAGSFADGASDDLSCTWTPSANERCAYDATLGCASTLGTKSRAQCYFIELRTASSTFYYPSGSDVFCESDPPSDAGTSPDAASDAPNGVADSRPAAEAGQDERADVPTSSDAAAAADRRDVSTDAPGSVDAPSSDDAPRTTADAAAPTDASTPIADGAVDAPRTPTSSGQAGCGCSFGSGAPRESTSLVLIGRSDLGGDLSPAPAPLALAQRLRKGHRCDILSH